MEMIIIGNGNYNQNLRDKLSKSLRFDVSEKKEIFNHLVNRQPSVNFKIYCENLQSEFTRIMISKRG